MKKKVSIPLRRAYASGSRRRLGFRPWRWVHNSKYNELSGAYEYEKVKQTCGIHTFPRQASIVRVGDDEIVVTDGSFGYMPFKLSELQSMLREARRLPIVTEFRCDVTP